ncbi:FAD-dependent oxidoreductase [Streptomyces cyaneofuscatus]|uniref:FAD-dependent oxidoreductase n=1 Tax=Streptomyces cyaneofuscatus TaxID=66883 RepID=UPI0036B77118
MEHIDVAVIGGGRSGLATARALLGRGLRPMVVEASDRTGRCCRVWRSSRSRCCMLPATAAHPRHRRPTGGGRGRKRAAQIAAP